MRYAKPEYTIEQVNRAAKILVRWRGEPDAAVAKSHDVLENWRASHAYPAQSFYVTLKRRACNVHKNALAAQRTKRLPSILSKLAREEDMKLSQMQDIGGCRAVLPNLAQVNQLKADIEGLRWNHERLTPKDYIALPKVSGYRGVHLKYRYRGNGVKSFYSGLKIEIQLRSAIQHRWATAVEAIDTFTRQSLKASGGRAEWKRFFALMSSIYAIREKSPLVPDTPATLDELKAEVKALDARHHIVAMFQGYATVMPRVEASANATYFLVTLDPIARTARIKGFMKNESQKANAEYSLAEKNLALDSPVQIVLVSVASVAALKKVYPNYFLDTTAFLRDVLAVTGRLPV